MIIRSSYLTIAFEHHSAIVEFTVAALSQLDFEIIAYRGESGALIAPTVAYVLNKKLLCIRKKDSSCHSSHDVEGWAGDDAKYVIIDDLVSSGATVRAIVDGVKSRNDSMQCVGLYLYRDDSIFAPSSQRCEMEKLGIRVIRGPLDPALDEYAYDKFMGEEKVAKFAAKPADVPEDFDEHHAVAKGKS